MVNSRFCMSMLTRTTRGGGENFQEAVGAVKAERKQASEGGPPARAAAAAAP